MFTPFEFPNNWYQSWMILRKQRLKMKLKLKKIVDRRIVGQKDILLFLGWCLEIKIRVWTTLNKFVIFLYFVYGVVSCSWLYDLWVINMSVYFFPIIGIRVDGLTWLSARTSKMAMVDPSPGILVSKVFLMVGSDDISCGWSDDASI